MTEEQAPGPAVRIVVADDHELFRDGLKQLLAGEPGLEVIGEAANADEAVRVTRALAPDILLLDVAMPRASGLEALRTLSGSLGRTRVIVLTASIDRPDIVMALRLGARGFVLKESATALLLKAIRTIMAGSYWMGRDTMSSADVALDTLGKEPARAEAPANLGLTARELQITAFVVAAASNREIAQELNISEKTVKHHLTNIFDKLGVSSRLELALFAVNKLKLPD